MASSPVENSNGEFWVIGVGASAGGLEALTSLVSNIPEDFQHSLIVAQHLAPHAKSMMVELLAKHSALPVIQVTDGLSIEAQRVYIVPPNHDLDIVKGTMKLTVADDAIRPKPSVDEFFESLAKAYGKKAVGIILSGTGTDGSHGIRAIRVAGGLTLAQDERSAKYDGMPKAAVETGCVDTILPPEQIAKNLPQMLLDHEQRLHAGRLDAKGLSAIFELIREQRGQDFRQYKLSTIQRRISKRMMSVGAKSFDEYYEKLKSTPGEVGELANELLISVTSFFRDADVFEDLTQRISEMVKVQPAGQEFRVWVAGCATGEEAYSIAMVIFDLQDRQRTSFPVKIFATDLDHDALQEARAGIYPAKELANIPARYRDRFVLQHSDTTFELVKKVRDSVVFARQDLIQNPPFVKLDLVSCRNVMIYFEPDLQRRVLEIFHYALLPKGLLVLGKSESILSTPQLFDPADKKTKIFTRRNVPVQNMPPTRVVKSNAPLPAPIVKRPTATDMLSTLAQKQLNRVFEIAGAVVDHDGTLIQVFGEASKYLKFSNAQVNLKISSLLPKNLSVEVPILIRKCVQTGNPHRSRTYKLGRGPDAVSYQVAVRPLTDDDGDETQFDKFFLLSFETKKTRVPIAFETGNDSEIPSRMAELEHELHVTREHLQTVIEELGVSNEELQSLNEELSSTNEELQATNEELETTNEELQSSNEELTTVNEEMGAKSSELRSLSVSLENIQNSIGAPLLILDNRLRLIRYNTDALKVFFVSPADIGRELTSISTVCEIPDFAENAKKTLETGVSSECLCEAAGSTYQVRLLPSYDESRKIVGVILVFFDNTAIIRAQERLKASESRVRAIIEASPTMISLKDNLGRYVLVNEAYSKFYGIDQNVIGKTDREVVEEELANRMRDADLEVFVKRAAIRKEETVAVAGGQRTILATRFPIMDASGKNPTSVGTIALDISSQVRASQALEESEARYKAIVEDQAVFVCRHNRHGELLYSNETFNLYFNIGSKGKRKYFSEIIEPADQEASERVLEAITPQHPVQHHEHRVSRWNEGVRWIRWIHRGVFSTIGEIVEYQSVGFDVTEYRKQTEYLKEREAVFTGVFSNTSDYITIFRNVNGELLLESLNRSAEHMLGYAVTQLLGRPLKDFFPAQQLDEVVSRYNRAIQSGAPQVFEEEVTMAGGVKYFSTTIVPIVGESGRVERVAALSRDISSYKAINMDLVRAKESAEVANRAKSDFLASMSHELRTPLNVVLGFCQMLELSDLDPEQTNYVGGIHRSGRLLLTLIEDVLDISKIEAGKVKLEYVPFKLTEISQDVVSMFENQAREKRVELKLVAAPEAAQAVLGDPSRIRQVLVNFVSNALKFTAQGSVTIDVRSQSGKAGSGLFRVTVSDTGIGIREEDHHKIFQKFSQAESGHTRRFGGTGLGLAISKQLITLMGGSVGFSSEDGAGSKFWFELPLKRTANEPLPLTALKPAQEIRKAKPLRILAVDDNYDSRMVVSLFLKRLGHKFETAENGERALEVLAANEFDIVLMDMQMPGMDGCETTIAMRATPHGKKIPIIALTANALTQDVERCLASGMDDYLSKPLRLEDLSALLNKWGEEIELNGISESTN